MVNSKPSPMKDYYIAYFDILGYKDFFQNQPEKVPELLHAIHDAVRRTNEHIGIVNQSPVISGLGNIDLKIKAFSDNILLCLEVSTLPIEQVRLLAFLQIIADIQRGFVIDYGLFVRGGILKGALSFNNEYVFGQGLIDVAAMEGSACYPRIMIDSDLIAFLRQNRFYSSEEFDRAKKIELSIAEGKSILPEENELYQHVLLSNSVFSVLQKGAEQLTLQWQDEGWILCYLNQANAATFFGEDFKKTFVQELETLSPSDYGLLNRPHPDFDEILKKHKEQVTVKLKQYGNNTDIATGDFKSAELREHILKKYVWVMAYHNQMCALHQKMEHFIFSRCNCDKRFMKMTIEVLDNETGI